MKIKNKQLKLKKLKKNNLFKQNKKNNKKVNLKVNKKLYKC